MGASQRRSHVAGIQQRTVCAPYLPAQDGRCCSGAVSWFLDLTLRYWPALWQSAVLRSAAAALMLALLCGGTLCTRLPSRDA